MFYKRTDPADGFEPHQKLLMSWEEGTDNEFQKHFKMYSSLPDSILEKNAFTHCEFTDSSWLAFGDCGPTAAVIGNAIG